ncbi:MAG: hypothetical protein HGA39_03855 [Coriobacteriia bacterium]|nr:hypothetical protein [Coriobacteriia bacterium]
MADRDDFENLPERDDSAESGGLDDARLEVRVAGYCAYCDRLVVRGKDGDCDSGHPAQAITGNIVLIDGEPVPSLPRFNLAAFLIPPIWGPAHGEWTGVIFLPIWLFMDSVIASAEGGGPLRLITASIVVLITLAFQFWFGRRGNGLAFRRVCDRVRIDDFVKRQRIWAAVAVPAFALLLGWAFYFHLVLEPTLTR